MNRGQVHVIAGCMFAGKTTRLIELMGQEADAYVASKPVLDDRYSRSRIVSHDGTSMDCEPSRDSKDVLIKSRAAGRQAIAIDEAQFFDADLPETVRQLRDAGHRIYVAGLDMDAFGKPFGPMPDLIALADVFEGLTAICATCGDDARMSFRRQLDRTGQIVVGGADVYEPRCETCWSPPGGRADLPTVPGNTKCPDGMNSAPPEDPGS